MKGRKPSLRLVNGEQEVDEATLIQPDDPTPDPPETMTNYWAKLEWLGVAPVLQKQGRLDAGLMAMLENYCVVTGMVREAQAMIENDGMVVNGRRHPAFSVMNNCMKEARMLAAELRLTRTPSSVKGAATEGNGSGGWGKDSSLLA